MFSSGLIHTYFAAQFGSLAVSWVEKPGRWSPAQLNVLLANQLHPFAPWNQPSPFYVLYFEQEIAPSAVREFIPTWRVYHNSCSNCSVFSCSRWSLRRIRKIWINEFWAILESGWSIWIYLDIWAISHENPISSIIIHCIFPISGWESHIEPIVVRLSHTFSPWHWRWNPVPPDDGLGSTSCQKPRDSSKHSIMNNGFCCDFAAIFCFWGLSFVMI